MTRDSSSIPPETRELMLRHLEGDASPEETRQLEIILRKSPAAQKAYAELLVQTVQLQALGQEQTIVRLEQTRSAPAWRASGWWAAAACVALLLAGAIVFMMQRNSGEFSFDGVADATSSMNGVATLTAAAGVVWENGVSADLDPGVSLSPGRLRMKAGVAELTFQSGVKMIVEGPADLRIISANEAALRIGRVSARVPPEARGFVVHSAEGRIVDLGTEFGLSRSEPGGPLEVHVFSGKVEVARHGQGGATAELTTGEAMELRGSRSRPIRADAMAFVSEEQLRHREFSELHERFQAWKQASAALANDPATLLHLDFQQDDRDRRVINRAISPRSIGGQIWGGSWTEGRWPGKRALGFSGLADKVQMIVPGAYDSLSYMSWIRVDSLSNVFNALSLSERRIPGAVHWQIMYDGAIEFSVRSGGSQLESLHLGWDRLLTRPVIGPESLGRWLHLAAVYDGSRGVMSVYLNGQLVQWKSVVGSRRLIPGEVGLGNWNPPDLAPRLIPTHPDYKMFVVRGFRGQFDEFTILGRVLSSDEIQRHYNVGRPSSSTHSVRLEGREGSNQLRVREAVEWTEENAG